MGLLLYDIRIIPFIIKGNLVFVPLLGEGGEKIGGGCFFAAVLLCWLWLFMVVDWGSGGGQRWKTDIVNLATFERVLWGDWLLSVVDGRTGIVVAGLRWFASSRMVKDREGTCLL